jgi:hypothetical protein
MTRMLLAACAGFALSGCFGYTETAPPSQDRTVIVQPGATVVVPGGELRCRDGSRPPC